MIRYSGWEAAGLTYTTQATKASLATSFTFSRSISQLSNLHSH